LTEAALDVDIVVAPDVENFKRVAEVAVEAGGHVQRGEALLGTPFSIAAELASGEQSTRSWPRPAACFRPTR
jgi:FAD synthase